MNGFLVDKKQNKGYNRRIKEYKMKFIMLYFLFFLFYSFLGWVIESVTCAIVQRKWVNRGFLLGPICPIYGVASLIMILGLTQYLHDPLVFFVMAVVICSIVEYLTSYIMEKLFHARWWDYSHLPFNINGRICLSNSVLFGILGIVLLYFIHPTVLKVIHIIPYPVYLFLFWIFFLLFLFDLSLSFQIVRKIKKTTETLRKDYTEEITEKVRQVLNNGSIFTKRLIKAFPNLKAIQLHRPTLFKRKPKS